MAPYQRIFGVRPETGVLTSDQASDLSAGILGPLEGFAKIDRLRLQMP